MPPSTLPYPSLIFCTDTFDNDDQAVERPPVRQVLRVPVDADEGLEFDARPIGL